MRVKIDHKANAAYVRVLDGAVARTEAMSDQIILDYDDRGNLVGVELLDIDDGVDLAEVLSADLAVQIERLLSEANIRTFI